MSKKWTLRIISVCMIVLAIVFVVAALSNPGFGGIWTIGKLTITAPIKRVFYAGYVPIALGLFVTSFFVKD